MKYTFKTITAILISGAILLVSSCEISKSFPAQTDPDTSQFDVVYENNDFEQDYSNIVAFTDKEEYLLSFEKITVTIRNETPGKGFRFFTIPVIEYNINGEWKRLNYSPKSYEIPEQWVLCSIPGDTESCFSTIVSIFNDKLEGQWRPGEYRAVVFAGKETIYAPFTIIDK